MSNPNENKKVAANIVEEVFSAEKNAAANLGADKLGKYNDIAVRMFHTGVLSPREMLLPAIGQWAAKLLKGLEVYRTLYFVNVLKIDMTYVTLILTLISIYDVLNNPLMGAAYDRTRTRWGKARPYIVFGSIPYFLSTAVLYCGALFFKGSAANDPKKIVFVFVILFIQETFGTIYGIPRENLTTLQTPNPKDRISVGLLNQYIGEFGSQLVYALFLPLMELNNKNYINLPMPVLFAILSGFACSVGAVGNIAMAVGCHERIALQPQPASLMKTIFYVLKNKYLLRVFIAKFATSWWSSGGYSWDLVTQQEIFGGAIPSMLAYAPYNLLDIVSVTFIPKFQKLFPNNRVAILALRAWDLLSIVGMCAFGIPLVHNRLAICIVFAVFHAMNAVNNGPSNVYEQEVVREMTDYTEYVTGERPDGTINILTDLIMKITAPLNTLLTIAVFKWTKYDPTIPMLPWSQGSRTVYQKVFFLFVAGYFLPSVVNVIPFFFYDLVGEKREQMYIALNERRALLTEEDPDTEAIEAMRKALEEEGAEEPEEARL